ncbi:MAG: hypothetical protein O7D91_11435 [Planctomycetota bacterium]|nr:hypothetical protein [Planctomycetota bacterium]
MLINELVKQVRIQLALAQTERELTGEPPLFILQKFELELNCVLTKHADEQSGLNLKIIELADKTSISEERVQKITLTFGTVSSEAQEQTRSKAATVENLANSSQPPMGSLPARST